MKKQPHFKIIILEDNSFYNKLVKKHIDNYIGTIALAKGFSFDIYSFTSFSEWERNFNPDVDIIITDYYLDHGFNAINLLRELNKRKARSKVVVISQTRSLSTSIASLLEGACEFIHKDVNALAKSGLVVEALINEQLKGNRKIN